MMQNDDADEQFTRYTTYFPNNFPQPPQPPQSVNKVTLKWTTKMFYIWSSWKIPQYNFLYTTDKLAS